MSNRAVTMDEVLDLVAYEKERPAIRAKMMKQNYAALRRDGG